MSKMSKNATNVRSKLHMTICVLDMALDDVLVVLEDLDGEANMDATDLSMDAPPVVLTFEGMNII